MVEKRRIDERRRQGREAQRAEQRRLEVEANLMSMVSVNEFESVSQDIGGSVPLKQARNSRLRHGVYQGVYIYVQL